MVETFRQVIRSLGSMDARAASSVLISLLMLVFVIVTFFYGQKWLAINDEGALAGILFRISTSPFAIVGVTGIFVILALTGFPQILLITATIITFGVLKGDAFSWAATMTSAIITFLIGRRFGARWIGGIRNDRFASTMGFLSRHGALASGLIRVVPSGPFVVINSAAGAARIPLWKYCLGTGIGIIPKIALVAIIGGVAPIEPFMRDGVGGVLAFFQNSSSFDRFLIALILPGWILFLLLMRKLFLYLRG